MPLRARTKTRSGNRTQISLGRNLTLSLVLVLVLVPFLVLVLIGSGMVPRVLDFLDCYTHSETREWVLFIFLDCVANPEGLALLVTRGNWTCEKPCLHLHSHLYLNS